MKKLIAILLAGNMLLFGTNSRTRRRDRTAATNKMLDILYDGRPSGFGYTDMGATAWFLGPKKFTDTQKEEIRAYIKRYSRHALCSIVLDMPGKKYTFLDHARAVGNDDAEWKREMEFLFE